VDPVLLTLALSLLGNVTGSVKWLFDRRQRRVRVETEELNKDDSSVRLVEKALGALETSQGAVNRMTDELVRVQNEMVDLRLSLAECVRAREEGRAERLVQKTALDHALGEIDAVKEQNRQMRSELDALRGSSPPLVATSTVTTTIKPEEVSRGY